MLSRAKGKPLLKPNKALVLKDAVADRKVKKGEATCITEMSAMMACWKNSNFVDAMCSNEMNAFYVCVEKAQADMKARSGERGIHGGRLHPKQATTLLKRFPNQRKEV